MVKQRQDISNSHFKPRYATFLMLAVCFVMILSTPTVLGFEFDNVKSYDAVTREVIITNAFGLGDEIGKVRLDTPLNVKVEIGYRNIANFTLWAYQDYSGALKQFTFTDMKKNKKINRDYDLKYLTYENIIVNDYDIVLNGYYNNGTEKYEYLKIGEHQEEKEIWTKITPANLKKNDKLIIGVFTEVQIGDYVDWVPTIYGIEIEEWATWEEKPSIILGLTGTDHPSFTVFNISGVWHGITGFNNPATLTGYSWNGSGWTINATMNNGLSSGISADLESFIMDGQNHLIIGGSSPGFKSWTWNGSGWSTNTTLDNGITSCDTNACSPSVFRKDGEWYLILSEVNNGIRGYVWNGTGWNANTTIVSGIASEGTQNRGEAFYSYNSNAWYYVNYGQIGKPANYTWDYGTNAWVGNTTIGEGLLSQTQDSYPRINTYQKDGYLNIIIGTKFTTPSYNGYSMVSISHPPASTIILNSPSSANYTTLQNIQINLTAYDGINLTDVKLYVNDVLNQTNASGINNSNYLFNLSLNDGDYTIYGKATNNESQETNSNSIRIVINTTPDIQFVSPTQIDNYNSSSSIIPINVTLTETYFQNITFNVNGTEYFYTNTNGTRYINNSYPDGNYTYNVTTCTTTNQCNTTETRIINIDAGKILTLSYPENNTIISNDTITFITILNSSDTSEEWINITYYLWNSDGLVNNETNIISGFNLTDNITFSNLTLRDYHWNALAWYGNPTHKDYMLAINGNFTFSIGGTVDEEIYENNTYETSSEIFSLNITLFEGVVVHAAYLYYDAIEYIGEITDLNNNQYSITKSIDVPLIDGGVENRSFHWSFIYTSPIQKTQNTTSKNQTVNPIFFGLCDANYTVHALDINIKEEGTFDDLNGTLEFASEYWLGDGTVTKEYIYSYLENNISSYDFCISPTYKTFNIDDIISYTATDYDRRDYFLDNAELSNVTMNLSLYLLQTATTDIFTVTVQDQDSKPVEGAFVNVQRWDIGTNNFYTIGMIKTTSDGTGIINSRLNDAWYRYQVIYNNILYLTTEPVKEAGTSRTLKINLEEDNPYNRFNDIDFSLTYDETTNISTFTFSDTTGAVAIGCLKVLKMEGNGTTEVYYSCVESASGTLSHQIEDDGTYIIRAIFKLSDTYDNIEQVVDEIIRQGTGHRFVTIGKFGQFISLMVVGTASMMGVATGSIPLGLGLIAVSLIVVNLLGWLNITSSVLYGIISIIILIAINLRRGK